MPFVKMHSHETLLAMGYTYIRPWAHTTDIFWYKNHEGTWELWQYADWGSSLLHCIYKASNIANEKLEEALQEAKKKLAELRETVN